MKKINIWLISLIIITCFSACREEYELQTGFDAPEALLSPSNNYQAEIDLIKKTTLGFQWEKSNSYYSGYVLYEIVFDKATGDFSQPIFTLSSDKGGGDNNVTLNTKQLMQLAKAADISINSEGSVKWTIKSSQGGEIKYAKETRTLRIKRPEGISDIPNDLYIYGTGYEAGTLENAFKCKKMDDGVFEIFGSMNDGEIKLCNATSGNITYYKLSTSNKLIESEDQSGTSVQGTGKCYRTTIDFNLLTIKSTEIQTIQMVRTWEAALGSFTYIGNHQFKAENVAVTFFYDWGWPEERYRFWVTTNEGSERWGSYQNDGMNGSFVPGMTPSDQRPDGGQPEGYYNVYNLIDFANPVSDWMGMYKLPTASENKSINVVIDMSPDQDYSHSITVLP